MGQLGRDHHLLAGGGGLGVVALHSSAVAVDKAAVGVGGVDHRLGVGGLITPSGSDVGSGPLAAGPGSRGQLGDSLLVALLAGGGLGFQLGFGVLQPGQPLSPTGQLLRQLMTANVAVAVLGLVDGRCLLEQLGDRVSRWAWVRLAAAEALASTLVPSSAISPRRTIPAAAHSFSDWISRPARACSWRTRNRAMVT